MGIAALFAALVLSASPPAVAADACDAPAEIAATTGPLRFAARAVTQRRALRVLVVGSASTTQGGTSTPAAAYPARLEEALRAAFPSVEVTVQTRGGRGLSNADLALLMDAGINQFRPDLVVWQTGTVDAVAGTDPDEFAATLRGGAERAAAARADMILMDPQFTRVGRATLNYAPYRQAMEALAYSTDVLLVRRYDLMKHWSETGQIDLERAPRRDWPRLADQLHGCLAGVLARSITQGVREARR